MNESNNPESSEIIKHQDVHVITFKDKTIYLVGTAHISKQSKDLVQQIIQEIKPDTVCVELDHRRYRAISQKDRWENLDIKRIIRNKELPTLIANLILSAYQKKLGERLGVTPGLELVAAVKGAEEMGCHVELCDRDVRITLLRAWRLTPFFKKAKLIGGLAGSLFEDAEIDEKKLEEMKRSDVISELMGELGETLPEMKIVLIDERDRYLAEKIRRAPGAKIVAVVGAGHVSGIINALNSNQPVDMEEISKIPDPSPVWKVAGWGIPAAIIAALVFTAWSKGAGIAGDSISYWVLANGLACAVGAAVALAHPLTIASAFAAAPITSLTPVIGAGYVTAFVQAMVAPPLVKEIQSAGTDINSVKGWWNNRLLKVFLAFILPSIGSVVGTWMGGLRIFSNLF